MPSLSPASRWRSWAAAGSAAALAASAVILAQAPASFLAAIVASRSQGRVEIGEAEGTVWRGRGVLVVASGPSPTSPPSRLPGVVAWRIDAASLLRARLDLTLTDEAISDAALHLRALASGAIDIDPGRVRLPAQTLVGLGAPWNTIEPGGELSLQWDAVQLRGGQLHGRMRAEWTGASSRLCPIVPLGHYRAELDGIYPGAQLRLETLSGPMELSGNGTIADGGRLRFRGTARAAPGTDAALATQLSGLISLLGPREGDSASLNFGP